jgi:hypothetical protein
MSHIKENRQISLIRAAALGYTQAGVQQEKHGKNRY